MPRKRARTTEIAKWDEGTIKLAVNDVLNATKKLREAARSYGIPVSTLRDRIKNGNVAGPRLGRKSTFSAQQEKEIADHIKNLARAFYGISSLELRRLVYEFAEKNNIQNNFNKASRLAGPDWLESFLKRNPSISLRKPEATSLNRIAGFNKNEVEMFFNNLISVMAKYKFEAGRIFNVDETGISTVQKPGKILAPKGVKQLGSVTSWERGKNITVTCAMSASGAYIPPMFIFPRLRMSPNLTKGGPNGSIYHCSKSGWMTEELFLLWLNHFISFTKPSEQSPVLLIMDNHSTHTTLAAYNLCKENNITVVTLPPHSSHRLQPLDVAFYGSLKGSFNKECDNFLRSHPHQKISIYDVVPIFNKAFSRIANIEKGISGFASTGIFPIDPEKFNDDFSNAPTESSTPNVNIPVVYDVDKDTDRSTVNNEQELENASKVEVVLAQPSTSSGITSIQQISPLPVLKATDGKSTRKLHSTVFTLTPNKATLEEAAEKKEERKKKKEDSSLRRAVKRDAEISKQKSRIKGCSRLKLNKSKSKLMAQASPKLVKFHRRSLKFDSDHSSEEEMIDNLCDDNEMDDLDPMNVLGPAANAKTREMQDSDGICLLCGEFGKNNELWYRCILCSGWVHSECSAAETADDFLCDFCLKG